MGFRFFLVAYVEKAVKISWSVPQLTDNMRAYISWCITNRNLYPARIGDNNFRKNRWWYRFVLRRGFLFVRCGGRHGCCGRTLTGIRRGNTICLGASGRVHGLHVNDFLFLVQI